MFHSAPSMSSIETNVGSPPIVRRTSQRLDLAVHGAPERADLGPLLLGVRLGHARVFEHARDLVAVDERHLALVGHAPPDSIFTRR